MSILERWKGFRDLPPDIWERLEWLLPLFEREGVLLAYIFGSLSRGELGQDVDLALLTRDQPAFHLREAITGCLDTQRLDLVDLRCASPVLRFEIVRQGQLFYAADQETVERFELATLYLYRDTDPLRRLQREYLKRRMTRWSSGVRPSNSVSKS